jgi:hypothetical protein
LSRLGHLAILTHCFLVHFSSLVGCIASHSRKTAAMVDRLLSAAQSELQGCSRVLIFDGAGKVLLSTFEASQLHSIYRRAVCPGQCAKVLSSRSVLRVQGVSGKDMQSLSAAVAQPREQAIRNGLLIQGRRYEVSVDGTLLQSIALSKGSWHQQACHLLCACLTLSILPEIAGTT